MTDEQKKMFRQACREAIAEVYATTLQLNATFDEDDERHWAAQERIVIATIAFAGSIEGSLSMIVSDRMACGLVSSMLETEIKTVDSEVLDGIGEILNMIAGGTKKRGILTPNFEVCIPSVILVEKLICVATLKHSESTTIVVDSKKGPALFLFTSVVNKPGGRCSNAQLNAQEVANSLQSLMKGKAV